MPMNLFVARRFNASVFGLFATSKALAKVKWLNENVNPLDLDLTVFDVSFPGDGCWGTHFAILTEKCSI